MRAYWTLLIAATIVMLFGDPASADMSPRITSPAFDSAIYNAGAIAQTKRVFGNWSLICADVNQLNRRFCNISSIAQEKAGGFAIGMVISTTDDGKPAAVLRMPLSVSLRDGVEVLNATAESAAAFATTKNSRKVRILTCAPQVCTGILPLEAADVQRLAHRGSIGLRVHVLSTIAVGTIPVFSATTSSAPTRLISVLFDGTGFAEALQASQSP